MDNTKECWFCHKMSMVPIKSYYQCTECGATWNEQPKLDFSPIAPQGYYVYDREGLRIGHAQSPSRSSARRAVKAREQAKGG